MPTVVTFARALYPEVSAMSTAAGVREPDTVAGTEGPDATSTLTWATDLSLAEVAIVGDCVSAVKSTMPLAAFQLTKADFARVRAYLLKANVDITLDDTKVALKSLCAIMRIHLRDT